MRSLVAAHNVTLETKVPFPPSLSQEVVIIFFMKFIDSKILLGSKKFQHDFCWLPLKLDPKSLFFELSVFRTSIGLQFLKLIQHTQES